MNIALRSLLPDDLCEAYRALDNWESVRTTPGRWAALRKFYSAVQERIERGEKLSPYFVDWHREFTPIEAIAWNHIRELGLRFWPQYPIDRFFVDFADLSRRTVVECDGKAFHDPVKDAERDAILLGHGWHVIRLTGRQLNLPDDHPESARHIFEELYGIRHLEALESDDE